MYDDVIKLLKTKSTITATGDTVETLVENEVFAQVKSIGMTETYEAYAVGLKPTCTFVLADYFDYDGEKLVDFEGVRYEVLRTYKAQNQTSFELVVSACGSS